MLFTKIILHAKEQQESPLVVKTLNFVYLSFPFASYTSNSLLKSDRLVVLFSSHPYSNASNIALSAWLGLILYNRPFKQRFHSQP